MASTEKCVVCLAKAVSFGGHVHIGNEAIIAGFCKEHDNFKKKLGRDDCKGCFGEWSEDMGIDTSFGQTGFIDKDGFHPIID